MGFSTKTKCRQTFDAKLNVTQYHVVGIDVWCAEPVWLFEAVFGKGSRQTEMQLAGAGCGSFSFVSVCLFLPNKEKSICLRLRCNNTASQFQPFLLMYSYTINLGFAY